MMTEIGQVRTVVTQKAIHVPSLWDACHSAPAHCKSRPGIVKSFDYSRKVGNLHFEVLPVMFNCYNSFFK